jgi:methanogenic corrinoid protein MtbC1
MTRETYRDPIFNLKAVVEATGVTADALRAWERRYGLPQPARTDAGHRIYSRRDIDIVKWLVARQEEGLRIGRAVELWRSLEEEGQDPLRKMPPPPETTMMPVGDRSKDLREQWISACLAFDEGRAEQVLTRAFALFPPEVVVLEVIQEGIADIGRRWYQGDATVQQEHFASQLTMRRLKTLMSSAPSPTRRGRILIACPPEEEHAIGPYILALLLRRAGWDVVYLGADVPLERMEQTVKVTKPDLVILAAQQLHTAANLLEMAELLKRDGVSTAFGGGIFNRVPTLRNRVPGRFLGATLSEAVKETERLIVRTTQPPAAESRSQTYQQVLEHYLDHQLSVEADVWRALEATHLDCEMVHQVNAGFSHALLAALRFGQIDLLDEYADWVERRNDRDEPYIQTLNQVFGAYYYAVRDQLDEQAAPILNWLDERLSGGPRASR